QEPVSNKQHHASHYQPANACYPPPKPPDAPAPCSVFPAQREHLWPLPSPCALLPAAVPALCSYPDSSYACCWSSMPRYSASSVCQGDRTRLLPVPACPHNCPSPLRNPHVCWRSQAADADLPKRRSVRPLP